MPSKTEPEKNPQGETPAAGAPTSASVSTPKPAKVGGSNCGFTPQDICVGNFAYPWDWHKK